MKSLSNGDAEEDTISETTENTKNIQNSNSL
jgi:hypothetical protein